jgi:HAD superfamily hydrolase (TIGR01450 family)
VTSTLIGSAVPLVEAYDLMLLDLDGVVYIGPHAVPGAAEALEQARAAGSRIAFVTNNASRPPEVVASHLRELGVTAAAEDVVNSAQAAAAILARRLPAGAAVLVVGGEGLYRALEDEGLKPVASMDAEPLAVVQGFSPDVGWRLLAEGTRGVRSGLPWIATNTDLTVPTPYGPAPGNGTLVAAVSTASGVIPEVAGKPRPTLFEQAAIRYNGRRPLVIGDRLDTDLEGARAAGMDGLAVLTGVTNVVELLSAPAHRRPHLIAKDLAGLMVAHPAPARVEPGRWACGSAVVRVSGPVLDVLVAGDDALDLVRAACAASWAHSDSTRTRFTPDPEPLLATLLRLEGAGPWGR